MQWDLDNILHLIKITITFISGQLITQDIFTLSVF